KDFYAFLGRVKNIAIFLHVRKTCKAVLHIFVGCPKDIHELDIDVKIVPTNPLNFYYFCFYKGVQILSSGGACNPTDFNKVFNSSCSLLKKMHCVLSQHI